MIGCSRHVLGAVVGGGLAEAQTDVGAYEDGVHGDAHCARNMFFALDAVLT